MENTAEDTQLADVDSVPTQVAPITRLATEILMLIFTAGYLSIDRGHKEFVDCIGSVCRQWRVIALNTSLLWTQLEIDFNGIISGCHLNNWLSRSRHRMLDLRCQSSSLDTLHGPLQTVMHVLAPHIGRWRVMRFSLSGINEMWAALSGLPSQVPSLEVLGVGVSNYSPLFEEAYNWNIRAPRLRRLVFYGIPCFPFGFSFHQHFPALTRVHLRGLTVCRLLGPGRHEPLGVLKALATLHHLEYLCIASAGIDLSWRNYRIPPRSERAILPALKRFQFQALQFDCIVAFMNSMEAPLLVSILFTSPNPYRNDGIRFGSICPVKRNHYRHFPVLQRLTVYCNNSYVVDDPYLMHFIGIFKFKKVSFVESGKKMWRLIQLAGCKEAGVAMKSSRLIGVEIHSENLPVPVAGLRQLVVGRRHSSNTNSSQSQPATNKGGQRFTPLEEIHVCTSTPLAEVDRTWFTKRMDMEQFSWSDSRACVAQGKHFNDRLGWLRMTFAPA
ncbi:hypothetical protein SCP_0800860 [Sparassis crispa]|uniref:Uncharacterized protein n=1 Tax=Sparassis crispa TaxID=139825 RepID=A0A401GTQ5_9APHY|nr:hypothetical protein SCP_0800860 [Sparassis crispa]GBE85569.1 hypothetical protein SCP_0800860 [Sparassis crispa]